MTIKKGRHSIVVVSRPASSSSSIIHPLVSGGQVSALPNVIPSIESVPPQDRITAPVSRSESIVSQRPENRPPTTPAYHDEHLNRMLPPKRELPFLKSSQEKSRVKKPHSEDIASRQSQSQPANQVTGHETLEYAEPFVPDSQQSQPLTQTQPPPEARQPSPMSSQLQPIPHSSLDPKPNQQFIHPTSSQLTTESSQQDTRRNTQNEFAQNVISRPATSVEEQLALYVSSPTPERIAFLENWMCELIEDDKFMTLCQDVEATWRRFAFGMKT